MNLKTFKFYIKGKIVGVQLIDTDFKRLSSAPKKKGCLDIEKYFNLKKRQSG